MTTRKILYKSGGGESFIRRVFDYQANGHPNEVKLSEEEIDKLEQKYSNIIFSHNHDRVDGYGYIILKGEVVYETNYEEDL